VQDELPVVPDEVACLLVLGHNPGWEDLVGWLTGEDIVMKTANAALLSLDLESWSAALQPGKWKLVDVVRPREL
jgi:phosphohistidine phosphatase SixA